MNVIKDANKGEELANKLLVGAVFDAFRLAGVFSLYFAREEQAEFEGKQTPMNLQLDFLEEWWVGSKSEWQSKVTKYGTGVEPSEPIQAFELAKFSRMGLVVSSVIADDSKLTIIFENGQTINAHSTAEDEYSYCLFGDCQEGEEEAKWFVTLDETGLYINTPL